MNTRADLKRRLLQNPFVDQIRGALRIDDEAYRDLCSDLEQLAVEWRDSTEVDKELVLQLYCMPQMVRNAYLALRDSAHPLSSQLEDIWVELDRLVLDVLLVGKC